MYKKQLHQDGFGHFLLFLLIVLVLGFIGFAGYKVSHDTKHAKSNLGDANSLDPMQKGLALSNGQCTGTGTTTLTHAPMDIRDVGNIQPYGLTLDDHVTPVSHEYYYQVNQSAPKDTYPVYATADGVVVAVNHVDNAWDVELSHSCTFQSSYNLLTSISPQITKGLPAGWGANSNGDVHVAVKAGDVIGYVGGQSLDFELHDTTKTAGGLLYRTAYNNREPFKVNVVRPLDYFSQAVKAQVLTRYIRTAEPRDGKFDYDVDGTASGNWFLAGTNGYAGGNSIDGSTQYFVGHLALTPDYIDPTAMAFSTGNFQGKSAQFAAKNITDWASITPQSGVVKIQLAQRTYQKPDGSQWFNDYSTGITMHGTVPKGTALIQMTGKQTMKVEVFPSQLPEQVNGFTGAAKIYNRGQDAHMVQSNNAT